MNAPSRTGMYVYVCADCCVSLCLFLSLSFALSPFFFLSLDLSFSESMWFSVSVCVTMSWYKFTCLPVHCLCVSVCSHQLVGARISD